MVAKPGPLIVVVGPTASGKSALALELAQRFRGELICADSRTVYKGLDIGTAKPTDADRLLVPHHLLDVVEPCDQYTAADFKLQAMAAITDITDRGRLPILVGGTGLYIDSVLYDFQFLPKADPGVRESLDKLEILELHALITERDIAMPFNSQNRRHLIRALETNGETAKKRELRSNTLILGLTPDDNTLRSRIVTRIETMLENGLIDEVTRLLEAYGATCPAFAAPGYKPFIEHVLGRLDLESAKRQFVRNDLHLAKRQKTWFRRNNSIQWLDDPLKSVEMTTTFLSKNKR